MAGRAHHAREQSGGVSGGEGGVASATPVGPAERGAAPERRRERGESEPVLDYLELCFDFWQEGREQPMDWVVLVEAGRIPDFRRHLMF